MRTICILLTGRKAWEGYFLAKVCCGRHFPLGVLVLLFLLICTLTQRAGRAGKMVSSEAGREFWKLPEKAHLLFWSDTGPTSEF